MKPVLGLAATVLLTLRCGVLYGQSAVEIQVREVVSERDRCVAQEERLAGSRDGVARALVVEERLSEAGLKLTPKGRANLESDVDAMTPEARLAAAREYVSAKPAAASRLGFWAQYQLRTDTSALTVEGLETLRGSLEWRQVMDSTADALIVSRCSNARAEKRKTHGPSAELTREERDRIQTQTREEVGKLLDEGRDELRARFLEATRDSMIAQLRDAKAEIAERKRTGRRADSSFVAETLLQAGDFRTMKPRELLTVEDFLRENRQADQGVSQELETLRLKSSEGPSEKQRAQVRDKWDRLHGERQEAARYGAWVEFIAALRMGLDSSSGNKVVAGGFVAAELAAFPGERIRHLNRDGVDRLSGSVCRARMQDAIVAVKTKMNAGLGLPAAQASVAKLTLQQVRDMLERTAVDYKAFGRRTQNPAAAEVRAAGGK